MLRSCLGAFTHVNATISFVFCADVAVVAIGELIMCARAPERSCAHTDGLARAVLV